MSLITTIANTGKKVGFKIAKHSPKLCLVGGILMFGACAITTGIAASKAKKVSDEFKETKTNIEDMKNASETAITKYEQSSENDNNLSIDSEQYNEACVYINNTYKHDKFVMYRHAAWGYIKLYSIPVVCAGVAIALLLTGHHILNGRYTAMVSAYTALQSSYASYRKKVAEKYGSEEENKLFSEAIVESATKKELEQESDSKNPVIDTDFYNMYAVRYSRDECPLHWKNNAASGYFFLKSVQCRMNDELKAKGYVTLNEVYSELGFPPVKSGCILGWVYEPKNPFRSNVIDFGLNTSDYIVNTDPEMLDFIKTAASADPKNGTKECMLRFNIDRLPIFYAMDEEPMIIDKIRPY